MEVVQVQRLYRRRHSHEAVLVLTGCQSGDEISLAIPACQAAPLALGAHGLHERCGLYQLFVAGVKALGGAFSSVLLTLDQAEGASASLMLVEGVKSRWIRGDVVESVALALHLGLPLYVTHSKAPPIDDDAAAADDGAGVQIPSVFHEALSDLVVEDPPEHRGDSGSADAEPV